ncbi:MAG: T9SS type A sorting domain-containing protein [Saprospiraceae bacterium]|nr:T9SS type A sorting domain-containing protein [Saprospiraceae bacterium]
MKQVLLSIIMFLPLTFFAQTGFEAKENVVDTTFDDMTFDPVGKGYVCNTGNDTISLLWRIEENSVPIGWTPYFCDKNLCYAPGTTQCPDDVPVVLAPGECGNMDLHLLPGASAQCGKYDVIVWEEGDTSNNLTMLYTFNCATSSINDEELASLNVFPNPATNYFQLNGWSDGITRISVHSLLGKMVREYQVGEGELYSVAGFNDGMYLVNLFDQNNKVVKTLRLTKK